MRFPLFHNRSEKRCQWPHCSTTYHRIICSDIPKYFPVFQFWQSLFSSKWVTPRVPKVEMAIPPVKQCLAGLLQYNGKCLQKEWRKKPSCSSIIKDLDLHSSNQQVNFSISFYKNTLHAIHININGTFFFIHHVLNFNTWELYLVYYFILKKIYKWLCLTVIKLTYCASVLLLVFYGNSR